MNVSQDVLLRLIVTALAAILYSSHLAHGKHFPKVRAIGGLGEVALIAAACGWAVSLLLYVFGFEWSSIRILPQELRWIGVGCMLLCVPLSRWVYRSLGVHFSPKLQLLGEHRLVTSGPYRFVRHPMYATFFLCVVATTLITEDLIVVLTGVLAAVAMAVRIRNEEAMLAERFAGAYRSYKERTGAIVPKLF